MLIDAHCHPFDLSQVYSEFENELKNLDLTVVASACSLEEFKFCEKIENVFPCFAIHPQLRAAVPLCEDKEKIILLDRLASEGRLSAIGECGFDLYNDEYKATEEWQDIIFAEHLEMAIKNDLPVILHVRRAMHKIFSYTNKLKKCKSVIFHSWPGTLEEGQSLLKRGVNAYFSFGNTIINGHKQQVRSCIRLPLDRILTETDAPYQPRKGEKFSSWKDIPKIIENISLFRNVSSNDMEAQIESNFNSSLCRRAAV